MTDTKPDPDQTPARERDEVEDEVMDEVLACYTDAIDERDNPHNSEQGRPAQ
ncbi:hypothetical protein [Streptomyces sp. NBC_01198]|uniref:hypothetical protein n=1 Tax=Streptomyces sp. NBC_01198 TaxID=2903769 RepID=UPI002E0D4B62|nr:hypothetical protein OG702_04210 [Streptomyces sp. NBC_01198]